VRCPTVCRPTRSIASLPYYARIGVSATYWLYGSCALGRETPGSDIDICLDAATLGMSELSVLETLIDELLLPKVDLVLLHQIDDPDLRAHIQHAGVEMRGTMASASEKQGGVC